MHTKCGEGSMTSHRFLESKAIFGEIMKIKKLLMVILITVCMVAGLSGCATYDNFKDTFFTDKGAGADTIKIGVLEPTTGENSSYGKAEIRGIEIAHKLHGKVLGKKVELVYEDTQSSIYTTQSAIQNILEKKPAVVLGTYGDACSLAAGEYLRDAKVPGITISATNPLVTENNEYYFRTSFSEAIQGYATAEYAVKSLNQNKVAVVSVEGDDTVSDMVNNFTRKCKGLYTVTKTKKVVKVTKKVKKKKVTTKQTITVAEKHPVTCQEIQIKQDGSDLDACIEQIRKSGVRTIFMATSFDSGKTFAGELDRLKVNGVTLIGPKEWHNNKLLSLQSGLKGIKIAVASDFNGETAETKNYKEFTEAYQKKYGNKNQDQGTVMAYDAYMLAIEAIEKAGSTDGAKVRDALAKTRDYSGASGVITFNKLGVPSKPVNIDVIKDGAFKTVYVYKVK